MTQFELMNMTFSALADVRHGKGINRAFRGSNLSFEPDLAGDAGTLRSYAMEIAYVQPRSMTARVVAPGRSPSGTTTRHINMVKRELKRRGYTVEDVTSI